MSLFQKQHRDGRKPPGSPDPPLPLPLGQQSSCWWQRSRRIPPNPQSPHPTAPGRQRGAVNSLLAELISLNLLSLQHLFGLTKLDLWTVTKVHRASIFVQELPSSSAVERQGRDLKAALHSCTVLQWQQCSKAVTYLCHHMNTELGHCFVTVVLLSGQWSMAWKSPAGSCGEQFVHQ